MLNLFRRALLLTLSFRDFAALSLYRVTDAVDVRVFFRLFQTAATGADYNSATTYRVGGQPGVKIPLLGIQGGELVTIPFFAEARNAANINLNQQTERIGYEGKISGLVFDRFGDFEGFWLDTEDGKRRFHTREKAMEELARTAWVKRIPVLVIVEEDERKRPEKIVLLRPPAEI